MAKIHVLDKAVSELIAAGEVIERPASIVKELLENAIDAKATAVTIEIKQGGIGFIRITDDGVGMEPEDVPTAFLRHATSKVRSREDLSDIATLGFRGEALASVCAVAKVELITKARENLLGCRYVVHGGEEQSLEEAGCPNGTTMIVRDLFYNVPARLKFLKKDFSEGNAVQGIVEKIALSHPEISFKLIKDNKTALHTPGDGKLISAVYAVFGKEFSSGLIPVSYSHNGLTVQGYVTKPSFARTNRSMQYFFVNDRYVKSRTCIAALEEGYKHSIMVGKFPACVLKLKIDFNQVDVNVHPAKIEIRFVQERPVFETVYFGVKSALDQQDILTEKTKTEDPQLLSSFRQAPSQQTYLKTERETAREPVRPVRQDDNLLHINPQVFSPQQKVTLHEPGVVYHAGKQESLDGNCRPVSSQPPEPERKAPPEPSSHSAAESLEDFSFLSREAFEKKQPEEAKPAPVVPIPLPDGETETEPELAIRMIGEVFKTYILFETEDLFIMMDKHAAHERILFEQLKEKIHLQERQILLTPISVPLSSEEADALLSHRELTGKLGFVLERENGTVRVKEAPLILSRYDLRGIVEDLAKNLLLSKVDITPQAFDDLLHSMACRAAIKANEDNTPEELEELAKQVYFDHKIRHCPHGRPVGITMTKYEIEKRFGRHN
ncbi:DNA mismatch repair endonuclease MutL [Massiliimalia massiliensis]|uniref:DNA mismatch repair endonuclease MutL n=1 Tax=Massiliimalia massiliensis TaxID=1852384 RepID=UPI0009878E9E|nr:DNA mismatch repair endonuclease MutL [Massiliimalia massiliensis]